MFSGPAIAGYTLHYFLIVRVVFITAGGPFVYLSVCVFVRSIMQKTPSQGVITQPEKERVNETAHLMDQILAGFFPGAGGGTASACLIRSLKNDRNVSDHVERERKSSYLSGERFYYYGNNKKCNIVPMKGSKAWEFVEQEQNKLLKLKLSYKHFYIDRDVHLIKCGKRE